MLSGHFVRVIVYTVGHCDRAHNVRGHSVRGRNAQGYYVRDIMSGIEEEDGPGGTLVGELLPFYKPRMERK